MNPPPPPFFGNQDVKTLIETSLHTENLKKIYNKESREEKRIRNLHELFLNSEIEKVEKHSSIFTKFVITCILSMTVVIGISLAIVVPCMIPLGTTAIWISSVVIVSLFLLLSLGAGLVFLYLHLKKDHYLGEPKNLFQIRVFANCTLEDKEGYWYNIIDISTLDKSGSGLVLTYGYFSDKEKTRVRLNSMLAVTCLPFITLGAMIYNICRVVGMPLYILTRILKEYFKKTDDLHKFKFKDIPKEMLLSLKRAIVAPFYSTAMFFSLVYSLISLRTGRVITGMVERAWNEDVVISKGYQLINYNNCHKRKGWKWEGGFIASQLGQNACYLVGCMQPTGIFLIENWDVVLGVSRRDVCRRVYVRSGNYYDYPIPSEIYLQRLDRN